MQTPIPTKLSILNAHERDANVTFEEGPHIYRIHGVHDKDSLSVTTLVHHCFPKFDAVKEALRIVNDKKMSDPKYKYYGMTQDEIVNKWKKSTNAGTELHYNIECYYNDVPPPNQDTTEFQMFMKFAKDYPHLEPFRTEWVIYHEELKLCGSIDMVFLNKQTGLYEIYDWKRVLEIHMQPFKNSENALLPFLEYLPNVNLSHYTMQLNIYKKILESKYNLPISKMFLVQIHPDNTFKTYFRLELADIQNTIEELFDYRLKQLSSICTNGSKRNSKNNPQDKF